ncbi:hypothetical protein Theco_3984 (plasmid) [Thermobacillus composti KWC4]|jgi:hypothetical protein|uniref:Phage ABA sandwich domain-containing protein n=1 Tax=Thermobacillus composti (strain DSM 18247 / JCM 13945 / KWC4) TaxID=717605 RepID=L0EI99_THECK|nr:hypothetical protein [Thermobacillus composti]AGA59988.1 hypothetical protein Theco_3984 [Thermobacillus composti KWC4]
MNNHDFEATRSAALKSLTRTDIIMSRTSAEPLIKKFNEMTPDERNRFIATHVMGWYPNTPTSAFYITHTSNFFKIADFRPAERIASAFIVFDYILVPDKTSLIPCESGSGVFWEVCFLDTFISAGPTPELAICRASIIITDAVAAKLNEQALSQGENKDNDQRCLAGGARP